MTTASAWVVGWVVTVFIVGVIVIGRLVVRRRTPVRAPLPPLVFPFRPPSPSEERLEVVVSARHMPQRNGAVHANGSGTRPAPARVPPFADRVAEAPNRLPLIADRAPPADAHVAPPSDDEYVNGQTIRFYRPFEQALQLLPGHLEVVAGTTREREIRFVRVPGGPPSVLLGREPGLLPNTIGLGSATVSRRHARMDYVDGHWHVKNLSRTNPLVVNNDQVDDAGAGRVLAEGDRLELGDVVLRFHEH